jgi:hypothetical protein
MSLPVEVTQAITQVLAILRPIAATHGSQQAVNVCEKALAALKRGH